MDFKNARSTAYVKTLDLQLNGNQINLSERPNSRDQLTNNRKVARSLRPCTLRRPMSATPSFGYRDNHVNHGRKLPPWSRPQSAGGSSSLRRNKLAAKFFDPSLNDPDYCPQFGATYTLSSSQLLQSLMGSCSINEGLNSDTTTTPTPSPQPSLGETIRAAAQLEPGLTGKPPLPPTPTPTHTPHSSQADDIISLKFQRWFPDAILESEIIKQTTLNIKPFEKKKDETDLSEAGTSELLDEDSVEKQPSTSNISSFVKKSRSPKTVDEDSKKLTVTFNDNNIFKHKESLHDKIPQKNCTHEPDRYGCDVVTEEFASEPNFRCPTPDNDASLKNSNHFSIEKNTKCLSLSDLNDSTVMSPEVRAHSLKVFSDSDIFKDDEHNARSIQTDIMNKVFSDVELNKEDDKESHINSSFTQAIVSRNEILSPSNFESSASNFRLTPVGIEAANYQQSDGLPDKEGYFTTNSENTTNKDTGFKSKYKSYDVYNSTVYDSSYNHKRHYSDISDYSPPPIILTSKGEEVHHNHLISQKAAENDADTMDVKTCGNTQGILMDIENENTSYKLETHIHLKNYAKPPDRCCETDTVHKKVGKRHLSVVSEKRNNECKSVDKYESFDSTNKTVGQKNKNHLKEINRAASVPPFLPSKSLSKTFLNKDDASQSQKTKRRVKRSMSYDANSIAEISEKDSGVSSYEDIVTMIKVLEKEDLESPVLTFKTSSPVAILPEQSSSAKAILNFLDEVERGSMAVVETDRSMVLCTDDTPRSGKEVSEPISSRLGTLLNTDSAELAKQVMTLTLQLEEAVARNQALEERQRQSVQLLKQQQAESNDTNKRHQTFIDQLLKEKRQLAVQYETAIKEMEAKQESAIKVTEERHKVEMRKAQEKFNAAEKIRRDKWIDTKTKKIKELTVRGLEPELERMAVAHQSELAELRRVHQRQLTEAEAAWARRSAALREQEAAERQTAVQLEREAARHRLEQEMGEVEKSYQEQRRRLLEEVRQEKELLQRQSERLIAEKHTELARQVDEAKSKVQNKLVEYEKKHQEEIAKLRESVEAEKQAWITRHKGGLEEKEATMREELKRERDRHIELVIRRLESEAAAKEQAIENKIKRLKESYDSEVSDLDLTLRELRARLKDARADLQRSEDHNTTLTSQLSHARSELQPLKQAIEKLRKEYNEAMLQSSLRVADTQKELNKAKQSFQDQVNKIHNEKENQLQQVYTRVKDAVSKKEEALQLVSRQRNAALEQCSRLEKLLETQRSHSLQL